MFKKFQPGLPRFLSRISRVLCQGRINKILSRVSRGIGNLRENPRSWQEFQDILHWEYSYTKKRSQQFAISFTANENTMTH